MIAVLIVFRAVNKKKESDEKNIKTRQLQDRIHQKNPAYLLIQSQICINHKLQVENQAVHHQ